ISDGVDILHLAARAIALADAADRDVDIGAHRALFHIAVAGAEIAQNAAKLLDISRRLFGRAHVRLGDNLHQRHAGTVEIDEGLVRVLVMQALAGVLLKMQAGDADLARLAVLEIDGDHALADDRLQILADLIALRQIGIEIILAIEHRIFVDLGFEAKAGPHRLLHRVSVDNRQHARHRRVDEGDLAVGRRAIGRGGTGEELRCGGHLRVDFKTDHNFPVAGRAFDNHTHCYPLHQSAGFAVKAAASSSTPETRNMVSSSNGRPITCRPSGSPSFDKPAGSERPGSPARLAGTVKTSLRYISSGSSPFSPKPKAAEGAVGVRMASTPLKAARKSSAMRARTFCAFR